MASAASGSPRTAGSSGWRARTSSRLWTVPRPPPSLTISARPTAWSVRSATVAPGLPPCGTVRATSGSPRRAAPPWFHPRPCRPIGGPCRRWCWRRSWPTTSRSRRTRWPGCPRVPTSSSSATWRPRSRCRSSCITGIAWSAWMRLGSRCRDVAARNTPTSDRAGTRSKWMSPHRASGTAGRGRPSRWMSSSRRRCWSGAASRWRAWSRSYWCCWR